MAEQGASVAQQHVEHAQPGQLRRQRRDAPGQGGVTGRLGPALPQPLQHPAEGVLAVRGADRQAVGQGAPLDAAQLPVMGIGPGAAPQLAGERMRVLQRHAPAVGPADMGDHRLAADRVVAQEIRHLGPHAGLVVMEAAATAALVERDAPAIRMGRRAAAPADQPGEGKADIGRHVGTHAQQLAHPARIAATRTGLPPRPG